MFRTKLSGSIIILFLFLMFLLLIISVNAELYNWDCPNCGRTGNSGNYCGTCAQPAPWISSDPTPESYSETTVNSWKELQQIINAIEGNQTIVLSTDISAEQDDTSIIIPSETSITINLQGHCINRASTESQNDGSVFIIHSKASLTIFDETKTGRITGGHTKELGGAIYNEGSLVINGVIIEGNTASQGGGLFIEYDAIVEINDSYINMNTADKDGGAIYSHGNITITNSVIHGNICYGGGAGIWSDGTATLESVEIDKNLNAVNGGGIASHGITTISNSIIRQNTASTAGGAIFHGNNSKPGFEASLSLNGVSIEDNTAQKYGGGIYLNNGSINLQGKTTISKNGAQKNGGGLFYSDGDLLVQDSVIVQANISNKKENDIHIQGQQILTLSGPLNKDAHIGIHLQNSGRMFITDYNKYSSVNPDLVFFDNSGKKVLLKDNEVIVK